MAESLSWFQKLWWWIGFGAGLWLLLAVVLLLVDWFRENSTLNWVVAVYLLLTIIASIGSFVAYGIDNRRAAKGRRRVSQRTLHGLALVGGWPGAVLGQRVFGHKTQKLTFRLAHWLIVLLHAAIILFGAWRLLV